VRQPNRGLRYWGVVPDSTNLIAPIVRKRTPPDRIAHFLPSFDARTLHKLRPQVIDDFGAVSRKQNQERPSGGQISPPRKDTESFRAQRDDQQLRPASLRQFPS